MSQRLHGLTDGEASGMAAEVIHSCERLLGRVANLQRILNHSPELARWFLGLVVAVRQPAAGAVSDVRLRNLATLKTSTLNGCRY
jgi:hypothetical protein